MTVQERQLEVADSQLPAELTETHAVNELRGEN